MEATTAHESETLMPIPVAHQEAAARYIAAIVRRERAAAIGDTYVTARAKRLLAQFEVDYDSLRRGPYSRTGADALRIALGRL